MEQVTDKEVRKIAWRMGDKLKISPEKKLNQAVKAFANCIWSIIYPEKDLWERTPKRP